jgi:hypothetical protein
MVSQVLRSVRVDATAQKAFHLALWHGRDRLIRTSLAPAIRLQNHLTGKIEASSDDLIGWACHLLEYAMKVNE